MITTRITNLTTGEQLYIDRDVRTEHPAWVHDQCGTASEADLMAFLDQLHPSMWLDEHGWMRGPDNCGVEMWETE